jgi:hypothetical protein
MHKFCRESSPTRTSSTPASSLRGPAISFGDSSSSSVMELRKVGQSFVHLAIMEMFQAARRVTIPDDMRRAIPLVADPDMLAK